MEIKQYQALVDEAKEVNNKDLWVAEYGHPADCPYGPEQFMEVLGVIYDVAHMNIKPLVALAGGLTKFAAAFRVPYPTAKKWQYGERILPEHELRLIGYALVSNYDNRKQKQNTPEQD